MIQLAKCSSFDRDERTTYGRCLVIQVGRFVLELSLTRR